MKRYNLTHVNGNEIKNKTMLELRHELTKHKWSSQQIRALFRDGGLHGWRLTDASVENANEFKDILDNELNK